MGNRQIGVTYTELITGRRRRPQEDEEPLETENEKDIPVNEQD